MALVKPGRNFGFGFVELEAVIEVGFRGRTASEMRAVADLHQVIQTAGNTAIAVDVIGVAVDAGTPVNTGVDFAVIHDRLEVRVNDCRLMVSVRVRVHEPASTVSFVIRAFLVAVAERSFE